MYKLGVPVTTSSKLAAHDREKSAKEFHEMGISRVFVSPGQYEVTPEGRAKMLADVADHIEFYRSEGFEVGVWGWTFWAKGELPFAEITSLEGKKNHLFYCPADPAFRAFAAEYIADIARLSPDLIQFDDDFRFTHFGNGVNCFCEHHLALMRDILGEQVDREKLETELFTGRPNRYRRAWMEAKAESLRMFARDIRAAVDRVNPEIRLGFCSCISNFGCEGVSPIELSKIFAGGTKPFMRLTGAPYWAVNKSWGNRLQNVIEVNRSEIAQCRDSGIEIFSEGDVYPRPRYNVPAAFLEMFDLALRASGGTDGILKYTHDYTSHIDYEKGYMRRHLDNKALYERVHKLFDGRTCEGVRVWDRQEKILDKTFYGEDPSYVLDNMLFNVAARMCADASVPTVYEGEGICTIAFGEDVLDVPRNVYKNGLIIDLTAAEILTEQGIDVGLRGVSAEREKGGALMESRFEHFLPDDEYINGTYDAYEITVAEGAEIDSEFEYKSELSTQTTPAAYFYENADGEKFFVFAHRSYFNQEDSYRSYARARQLRRAVERLSGKRLPAFVDGNPDVYLIAKRGEDGSLAVALFNLSIDTLLDGVVELDGAYSRVSADGAEATLVGDRVHLSRVAPFSFVSLHLTK